MTISRPSSTRAPSDAPVRGHVVVAVGRSDPGSAARWAAREAGRTGTTVRLLHVAPHHPALAQGSEALRVAAAACRDEVGERVQVEEEQVVGDPGAALLEACHDARLVVTGRRSSTSWHSTSSVSAQLAGRLDLPVCVVPPSWSPSHHDVVDVGLTPGGSDRRALTEAVRRARLERAVLRVLVCRPGSLAPDHETGDATLRRDALAALAEAGGDACDVEVTVTSGHPASQLLEAATTADLLVLGRRRHHGEHPTYLGPVARAVLPWAACPVLLARPGPTDEGADHARR